MGEKKKSVFDTNKDYTIEQLRKMSYLERLKILQKRYFKTFLPEKEEQNG